MASTRSRALALGKSMSARYRDSEERFRRLNELLPTLVLLVDRQSGDIVAAGRDDAEDKDQRDRELGRGMQRMHGRVFFRQLFQRKKRVHGFGDFLHAAPVPGYHPPAQF